MSDAEADAKLSRIAETLLEVLRAAEAEGLPPGTAADRLAEARMAGLA
jgi:valine dehydrogenase (NAD+)